MQRNAGVIVANQTVVKLYVSNIPYSWGEDELEALFRDMGTVTERRVIRDRETGRSKGFGFVSIDTWPKPTDCWHVLQGTEVSDSRGTRRLTIDMAKPKPERTVAA